MLFSSQDSFDEYENDPTKQTVAKRILDQNFAECNVKLDRYHKSIKFLERIELLKRALDKQEETPETFNQRTK